MRFKDELRQMIWKLEKDKRKVTIEGISLAARDYETIQPKGWLNDLVIDAAVNRMYNTCVC